jgi:hypothetical protein
MKLPTREFIMIASKDGAGKSCALVSMAMWVQNAIGPDATFFVIDTENKFPTALKSFGPDAPTNICYFKCETMNDVTDAYDAIANQRKMGDWLAVESMGRIWERSQDLGYQAVSGYSKAAYLEKRRELAKAPPVIPKPDDFWNVVKGAHDSAFLDLISQASSLNAILTTTISKPPKAGGFIKENETRKEARVEFGIDAGIDGAPRIPYYVETLCMFDIKSGKMTCRVLRDNNATGEESRKEFEVENKKMWGQKFWMECRG